MQRSTLIITSFLALLLLAAITAPAQITYLQPGYEARVVNLPFLFTGSDISPDPADPDSFFIASDFYRNEAIYHVSIADPDNPVARLIAAGTVDQDMSGAYDNRFGSTTVFSVSATQLIIADNDFGTSPTIAGVLGQSFLLATDNNLDDDFLDAGEMGELVDPSAISTTFFKGAIGPDARHYITTADGAGAGEVIVFNSDGSGLGVFAGGLSYGAGVGFLSDGTAVIGNADDGFATGSILLALDGDSDGLAVTPGEVSILTNSLLPIADLDVSNEDEIFAAVNGFLSGNKVVRIDVTDGSATDLIAFTTNLPPFGNFVTNVAFDSSNRSFAPGPQAMAGKKMLVSDYSLGLVLVTPSQATSIDDWFSY